MTDNATFRTTNLSEAASLHAAGAQFLGLEPKSHRTFQFVFASAHDCEHLLQQYMSRSLTVDARTLCECLSMLKDRVFTALRQDRYRDAAPRTGNYP